MDDAIGRPATKPVSSSDLEIKEPQLIFKSVWEDLVEAHGRDHLRFPREYIWLGGAPGAGKGTNTPFIRDARGISAPPIVISSLLTSPRAVAIKNAGKMVEDREVTWLLFEELLKPEYSEGVIIDGYPRTKVQVECLKLFYHALLDLHNEYRNTPLSRYFRKPLFRIVLLYVTERVSVERQLKRGREIKQFNQAVRESGIGTLQEERETDVDPALCAKRYQTFKESTFDALQSLRKIFHFHYIDAEGTLPEVQQKIVEEFSYQSSLELSNEVFDLIHKIPVATELAKHARQELVERLEEYHDDKDKRQLFQKVIKLVEEKFVPIVKAHAITGHARINTENELLDDPLALRMMIDVLSERGFHALVDIHRMDVPVRVNPETWDIVCKNKKVFRIEIRFPPSEIRRGH